MNERQTAAVARLTAAQERLEAGVCDFTEGLMAICEVFLATIEAREISAAGIGPSLPTGYPNLKELSEGCAIARSRWPMLKLEAAQILNALGSGSDLLGEAETTIDALCEKLAPFVRNAHHYEDSEKLDAARTVYGHAHDVLKRLREAIPSKGTKPVATEYDGYRGGGY